MKTVLLWLLMACAFTIQSKEFSFPALTQEALTQIIAYQEVYPERPMTITITGKQTVFGACSAYVQKTATTLHSISLQNIALKGLASLFGATVLSYTFIAYFIYRVYRLLAKISSWLAWNDHVQEHDMVEEAKQYLARTALEQSLLNEALVTRSGLVARKVSRKEIQEQKQLLEQYLALTNILKKYKLRALFAYDQTKEDQLRYALAMLSVALETSSMQDERC